MWHVDFRDGNAQSFPSKGEAKAAAEAIGAQEGRIVKEEPPPAAS